jgi:ABC-type polar amino acid transport system ATPase subunit
MPDHIIEIRNLHKWFKHTHALDDVSLDVETGEVLVIIGPSGSGKSTLLRCINHRRSPRAAISSSTADLEAKDTDINAVRTEIGSEVFQQFNLFRTRRPCRISPWQRVVRKRSAEEAERVGRELLKGLASPKRPTPIQASFPEASSSEWLSQGRSQ